MKQFRVLVVVGLVATSARAVYAQDVSRFAIDFSMGSGPHSERVGETWFRDLHNAVFRAGGAVRLLAGDRRFAPVVRVDLLSGGMGDQTSDCPPAPNGTCRRYFPKTDGPSIGAGVLASFTSRDNVEATAGVVRSTANRYAGVSASYRLVDHFAVLVDWRYFSMPYVTGNRVSYRPWQFGVRFF